MLSGCPLVWGAPGAHGWDFLLPRLDCVRGSLFPADGAGWGRPGHLGCPASSAPGPLAPSVVAEAQRPCSASGKQLHVPEVPADGFGGGRGVQLVLRLESVPLFRPRLSAVLLSDACGPGLAVSPLSGRASGSFGSLISFLWSTGFLAFMPFRRSPPCGPSTAECVVSGSFGAGPGLLDLSRRGFTSCPLVPASSWEHWYFLRGVWRRRALLSCQSLLFPSRLQGPCGQAEESPPGLRAEARG